jgi:segregation and condensation protein B
METLAIVAYTQPCTKGEIEEIRGVSADSVIATLLDRRFLVESGRRDTPGRPLLYKTTPDFLEAFGLNKLDDLPKIDLDAAVPVELALPIPTVATAQAHTPDATADEPNEEETQSLPSAV